VSISSLPVRPIGDHSEKEEAMREDEKGAVYAAYKAINETPGVSPGVQMQPPETASQEIPAYALSAAFSRPGWTESDAGAVTPTG